MQTSSMIADLAQSCVQAFAKASGIGCELCSPKGEVIASDGFCCSICDVCSKVDISKDDCIRLHAFTAKASEREDGKYMYECPLGFSCITSAVLSDSIPGARLTLGPFLMEDRQDFAEYDLTQLMKLEPEAVESVKAKLGSVPVVEPQAVNAFSHLLVYSAAFLSSSSGNGDYLSDLESGSIKAWEKENRIDPSETVAKVTGYMEENFSKDISLLDIARHAGMTTSYLCRLFKKEMNTTVNAYLTRVRIDKGKELLETDESIADIAKQCGFSDQSYFTKVFRQTEGMTPLKYRKNCQNS